MTDAFATAARAEAPPACEHYWISHSQDSVLIPWVIRCHLCGAFNIAEMERVAHTHLAAQEPTDAEVEALAVELSCRFYLMPGPELPWEGMDESERGAWRATTRSALSTARAALTAAKEAR